MYLKKENHKYHVNENTSLRVIKTFCAKASQIGKI